MPTIMKVMMIVFNLSILYYLSPIFSHSSETTVDMRIICLIFTSIGLSSFYISAVRFIYKNMKIRRDI